MTAPMGCRHCGAERRPHGQRWTPDVGVHGWAAPFREQIAERLRARLTASRTTRKDHG